MSFPPCTDRGGQAPALRGASKPGCLSYPIRNQKWTAFSRSVTIHILLDFNLIVMYFLNIRFFSFLKVPYEEDTSKWKF